MSNYIMSAGIKNKTHDKGRCGHMIDAKEERREILGYFLLKLATAVSDVLMSSANTEWRINNPVINQQEINNNTLL